MVRICASVALFLSLASLRLPAQSKDSEIEHIRPTFSKLEDVPRQPIECLSKHNDKLFVSLQSGNSAAGFIMDSYAKGDSRILEINYHQAMAMPRPSLLFELVRICESWVNTNSVPYPGHEDSLHDYPDSSADRDAIRWIRDHPLSIPWVRGNKESGRDDNVSAISIVDSIAHTMSDKDRGEFVMACYRTDTPDCKPAPTSATVLEEHAPTTISIRSDEAVRHTEAAFKLYLGDADEEYRLTKSRLGLAIYSASSFSTSRVLRVQATKANSDQQVNALKNTLESLRLHCEDLGLHGMATYIFYRKKIAEKVSKKNPQVYIAEWVHQVDDVFAKLNQASQTIAISLTVQSDPSQNRHFTLKSRTGFIEIDTKTNSKVKNAYRGLYIYSVETYGGEQVKGYLNLIDAQGSAITCHLTSVLGDAGLIDPFCEIQ